MKTTAHFQLISLTVTKAEAWLSLIEHHMALSASDHAVKLFCSMFPVPGIKAKEAKEIIQKSASSMTKTSALVHELCNDRPFNTTTDGSNATTDKLYPSIIRYETTFIMYKIQLLSLLSITEQGIGENIANTNDAGFFFSVRKPRTNDLGLCMDNTNTMFDSKSGTQGTCTENRWVKFPEIIPVIVYIRQQNGPLKEGR